MASPKFCFADRLLFDQAPIDFVGPTDTGIPDVQFAMITTEARPDTFTEVYELIYDAKKLGMKGLRIDDNDYESGGLSWEIWFAGSPEDVIIFSLTHKNIITLSQEEMVDTLNKARVLLATYPTNRIDFCYVISRMARREHILMRTNGETQIRDVSHLVDYSPIGYLGC